MWGTVPRPWVCVGILCRMRLEKIVWVFHGDTLWVEWLAMGKEKVRTLVITTYPPALQINLYGILPLLSWVPGSSLELGVLI